MIRIMDTAAPFMLVNRRIRAQALKHDKNWRLVNQSHKTPNLSSFLSSTDIIQQATVAVLHGSRRPAFEEAVHR
jgi:hypothetical protein